MTPEQVQLIVTALSELQDCVAGLLLSLCFLVPWKV